MSFDKKNTFVKTRLQNGVSMTMNQVEKFVRFESSSSHRKICELDNFLNIIYLALI